MEARTMRETLEKMGWSLSYYDGNPWHPETISYENGDIDLYGVDDLRTDEFPLLNSQDADYFCTVKKEDSKNVRVDKGDADCIPLLVMIFPNYHFYVK